ncbi:type III-B CRISPR module RAMP protein Cmr1 [Thermodesulfatator atlanticus]|uniref:type III-B CRISPR module RAMP protein Cmr1 n=1 Tax=Thermodesulfatator atlanticus TaxID=501497 RepID=UPI0009FD1273|nr:type III-B CRISPR module RAMP protein Cmr1 [Thermodesulfatator atlanticus]
MMSFSHLIKPTSIELRCRILTPMFLGDAYQQASLRAAPFKGLLRYWWRVAAGLTYKSPKDLLKAESEIFGGGGEKARRSLVKIWVEGNPKVVEDEKLPGVKNIFHPEVGRSVNPLLYLGYGPVTWDKKLRSPRYTRSYLAPGATFVLKLTVPVSLLEDGREAELFKTALLYFRAFGAAGARSRNGWGSFQVEGMEGCYHLDENFSERLLEDLPYWKDCFDKSYPHTPAKGDNSKLLLWKREGFKSWEKAMKFLAEVYIYLRTSYVPEGYNWSKKNKIRSRWDARHR